MDLNMLASDLYVVTTTSRKGSRYDDMFSQSYGTDDHSCHSTQVWLTKHQQSNPTNILTQRAASLQTFSICLLLTLSSHYLLLTVDL